MALIGPSENPAIEILNLAVTRRDETPGQARSAVTGSAVHDDGLSRRQFGEERGKIVLGMDAAGLRKGGNCLLLRAARIQQQGLRAMRVGEPGSEFGWSDGWNVGKTVADDLLRPADAMMVIRPPPKSETDPQKQTEADQNHGSGAA